MTGSTAAAAGADVSRAAVAASFVFGLLLAAALGHFLFGVPVQLSDSFGNMLQLQTSWRDLLVGQFSQRAYLRPFLWAELKLVFDVAQGSYTAWFRSVHAAQVVALVVMFLMLIRPRTWRDAAVVPLGLAALLGVHTFAGTVIEAFPINTYLTILLCCLLAAIVALSEQSRWWKDAGVALLLVVAALTVESGLLVGVIVIGAVACGAKGVSKPGAAAVALLMLGYFALRYTYLNVGGPGLEERSSGFGFGVLEPDELTARFGAWPYGYYAYNVLTSFASVLFSEPRGGMFLLTASVLEGAVSPALAICAVASTLGSIVIGTFIWQRRRAWLQRTFDRGDVIVVLFVLVLGANAVLSYPYTKDVIMSPAGLFYAAALFVSARYVLGSQEARTGAIRAAAVAAMCLALGVTWSIRQVGIYLNVREAAYKTRNDWGYTDVGSWLDEQGVDDRSGAERLFRILQGDVIRQTPPPQLRPSASKIFDIG